MAAEGNSAGVLRAEQTAALRSVPDLGEGRPRPEERADSVARWLGWGGLVLLAATGRLWTPQQVFPRIPLWWWAPPAAWDWSALAVTVCGLALLGIAPRRFAAGMASTGLAALFLADQHRLQPWAWQLFVLATIGALGGGRLFVGAARLLTISIYAWSALSKCDAAFSDLIRPLVMAPVELLIPKWDAALRHSLFLDVAVDCVVWSLPAGELVVAVLLARRPWRTAGLYASWFLHVCLLGLLGPFGQGHSLGVVCWNLWFIGQNSLLFWPRWRGSSRWFAELADASLAVWRRRLAGALLAGVLIWPATEPWGYCDAWLGWAVYVPRFDRVTVWLDQAARERLPPALQAYVAVPEAWFLAPEDAMVQYRIGAWSLAALGVPAYPHSRSSVGTAVELAERYGLEGISVVWSRRTSRFERWSWDRRATTVVVGRSELARLASEFRVNAFPESWYRRVAEGPPAQ
jgi:hypothetical protein